VSLVPFVVLIIKFKGQCSKVKDNSANHKVQSSILKVQREKNSMLKGQREKSSEVINNKKRHPLRDAA